MKEVLIPPSDSQVHQASQCSPSGLYPPEQDRNDSDNPWKLALESSGEGVWDWNVVTGEQTHSRQWKEMLGYAEHEIGTGYHEFTDRVHPDDIARVQAAATAYMEGRAPDYSADLRLRCKDGSWKWILTRGMVVSRDARGQPLRMIGTHTDITERKQAEETLRELNLQLIEQTGLLQTTLASISQGIFMLDASGRVSTYNPRVCELLDMPESFLATRPTTQEMTIYQLERGDFGPDAQLMDPSTRSYVMSVAQGTPGVLPSHYLRQTPAGRTLEVKTQILPDGRMVRTFADVTDYVQAEESRKQLNLLLDATQAIARVGGWDADIANDRIFWTAGIYRLLETSAEQYTPTTATASQFFTPQARELIKASYGDGVDQPEGHDLELEMVTARGRRIWVHSMGTTTWEQGKPVRRTAVLQDITERKQNEAALRENEERWKLALESTGDGVWDWYVQTGEEFFSKRLKEMYGFGEHEMPDLASELDARTHPEDVANMHRDRQAHFDGITPTYINEHRVRCRDGNWKWVLARGMVISRDAQGRPLRMIGTHTDITDRKRSEALVWQQAHFDALTGLPNRNMLRDRLEQEIKKSRRDGLQLACLFIDLDHFKEVNDTLGHDSGDLLLIEAARRIRDCVREADTVARMGGDEFTVILTEVADVTSIERILQKLLQALEAVFELGNERVFVSASIGITMYPLDATEIEDLFKNADQALYVAKGAGRNRFSFFTPALQEAAQMRVRLANDLRGGLVHQQFKVVYQPIVELATGAVHKAEALIRWHHPTRGLVSPADFIPIAEASGLIVDIGDWVFRQAAHQVKAWRAALDPGFQISVNKSPVQFHQRGGSHTSWDRQLQAMGLPGESIVVEITEGLLLDTSSSVADQLLELRDAGIQVSLDDFGTGYSSLSYLQKFDIDFIKIDQSFVRHLIADSTDLALCNAIIVMAHALGIKVIAEGVETPLQRDLLVAAGCDYAQGYLFSRPISAPDFEAFVAGKGRSGR
ncbi:MAG: EAL domain-containing protein [Rhodoferax sp.]|nr:EAL domain-containing protein [Rhodoferax sp.]